MSTSLQVNGVLIGCTCDTVYAAHHVWWERGVLYAHGVCPACERPQSMRCTP